jgi:hypothetical protein
MAIEKSIFSLINTNAIVIFEQADVIFGSSQIMNTGVGVESLPKIIFYKNSIEPYDTKGTTGLMSGRSTLDLATIKIDIFSTSAIQMDTLGMAVRNALDRYSGTIAGCEVQSIRYTNESNEFSFDNGISGKGWFMITQYYDARFVPQYS